jgi:hypothetical protein
VARSPTAYEQAGQKHGRTIPLAVLAKASTSTTPLIAQLICPGHLKPPIQATTWTGRVDILAELTAPINWPTCIS